MRRRFKRGSRVPGQRQKHRLLLRRIHKLVRSKLAHLFFHLQGYRVGLGDVRNRLRAIPRRGRRPPLKPKKPFFRN